MEFFWGLCCVGGFGRFGGAALHVPGKRLAG